MPRTLATARLQRQLLGAARTDGVALVHVAIVVEHNGTALMLHCGDGDAFSPSTWQVPTGLLLGFTVAVTDPTRMRRSAVFGHQWVRLDQAPLPLPAATTAASRHFLRLAAGHPAPQLEQPPLAAELRARSDGLYTAEAGCELLINHATWLHRADFPDQFVHTGPSITDNTTPMAHIDWSGAGAALDTGRLPCSGGEARILRIAASLAHGIPVKLGDALTGLDHTNLSLIIQAVATRPGDVRHDQVNVIPIITTIANSHSRARPSAEPTPRNPATRIATRTHRTARVRKESTMTAGAGGGRWVVATGVLRRRSSRATTVGMTGRPARCPARCRCAGSLRVGRRP